MTRKALRFVKKQVHHESQKKNKNSNKLLVTYVRRRRNIPRARDSQRHQYHHGVSVSFNSFFPRQRREQQPHDYYEYEYKKKRVRRTNLPGTLRDVVAPKSTPRVDVHRPRRRRVHFNRRFERRVTVRGNERSRVGDFERWDHE